MQYWDKQGNFSHELNLGRNVMLRRKCTYEAKHLHTITEIELLGYDDDDIIAVTFLTEELANSFLKKLGNQEHLLCYEQLSYRKQNIAFTVSRANKAVSPTYLKLLIEEEPHVGEILPDICQSLNISEQEVIFELLKNAPVVKAILQALACQDNKSYDLIYQLLTHYWEQSLLPVPQQLTLNEIFELACAISTDNPHYAKAQDFCVDILMRQDFKMVAKEQKAEAPAQEALEALSLEEDEFVMGEGEYSSRLELKLRYALKGTRQDLTDMLYNELCGYGLGLPAKVKNIKGDADTLLSLAAVIKSAQPALKQDAIQSSASTHGFFANKQKAPSLPAAASVHLPLDMGMD